MSADVPAPGSIFASKYEILDVVGRGGMGVVLSARHARLEQTVAIKLLKPELLSDAEARERFEREARAAAKLTSAHAARIFDVDSTADGVPYMVMELLHGRDLGTIFNEHARQGRPLEVTDAVDWVLQACIAMAEAHAAGIVHRDLKPSNLFLAETSSGPMVKVLDFGISKLVLDQEAKELTVTATVLGTPNYMSPEQIMGRKQVDARADLWSLAVILYRALTQNFPFSGAHPTALAVAIAREAPTPVDVHGAILPEGLAQAIMRGLEKDPDARFQSAQELAAALAKYGSGRWNMPSSPFLRARTPALGSAAIAAAASAAPVLSRDAPTVTANTAAPVVPQAPSHARRFILVPVAAMVVAVVATASAYRLHVARQTPEPVEPTAPTIVMPHDETRVPVVHPHASGATVIEVAPPPSASSTTLFPAPVASASATASAPRVAPPIPVAAPTALRNPNHLDLFYTAAPAPTHPNHL